MNGRRDGKILVIKRDMIPAKEAQFFLATHSPFILNDLLENGGDELAVFIV